MNCTKTVQAVPNDQDLSGSPHMQVRTACNGSPQQFNQCPGTQAVLRRPGEKGIKDTRAIKWPSRVVVLRYIGANWWSIFSFGAIYYIATWGRFFMLLALGLWGLLGLNILFKKYSARWDNEFIR